MTKLSVVGTPIGNLGDITLRAIEVFKGADVILCEDTRVTKKLLSSLQLDRPLLSYHSHSKISKLDKIVALLQDGKNLVLVSDAGTPGISDPGSELIKHVKKVLGDLVKVEVIPGPSALTAALSVAGISGSEFTFLGFLPHKKGRETLFKEIAAAKRTIVFYESPHRIMKTLESLILHLGESKRVTVCRELTKIYEEVVSGRPAEVKKIFDQDQQKIRGEFVVIISGLL